MRLWTIAVVLVAIAARDAWAQQPSSAATLPPIGLPLPVIGLPLPPIGLAPPSAPPTPTRSDAGPRRGRGRTPWLWGPAIVFVPVAGPGATRPGDVVRDQDPGEPAAPTASPSTAAVATPPEPPAETTPTPAPPPSAVGEPEPPPAPKPLYFVPGCYLGDVPPADAHLPATCDLTKTVVYRP